MADEGFDASHELGVLTRTLILTRTRTHPNPNPDPNPDPDPDPNPTSDPNPNPNHAPGVLASSLPPTALKGHLALEVEVGRTS